MTIRTFDAVPLGTVPGATLFQLNEQCAEEGELEAKYQMIVGHFIKAKQYQDSCKPELMNSAIWQAYQGWKK